MKTILFYTLFIFCGLTIYCQNNQNNLLPEGYFNYYQLNNKNKQDLIVELGNRYKSSLMQDTIYRNKIVNFLIDTVVANDKVNNALASKVLLQCVRLNEIDIEQKEELLNIYINGWFNVDLTQLIGLIEDDMFVKTLNNLSSILK